MERYRDVVAILNLLGSIASITGVSFLWMLNSGGEPGTGLQVVDFSQLLGVFFVVIFYFGLLGFYIVILKNGYRKFGQNWGKIEKATYYCLGITASVVITLILTFRLPTMLADLMVG